MKAKIKKVNAFGIVHEKDYLRLRLEKKQEIISNLRNLLEEAGVSYPPYLYDEKGEPKIETLTDHAIRIKKREYEFELFFGHKRVILTIRAKEIKKIINLVKKYFEFKKG